MIHDTYLGRPAQLLEAVDALGSIDGLPQGCLVALVHSLLQPHLHPIYGGRHLTLPETLQKKNAQRNAHHPARHGAHARKERGRAAVVSK